MYLENKTYNYMKLNQWITDEKGKKIPCNSK